MSFDLKAKICKDVGPYSKKEIRFYYPYKEEEKVLFRIAIEENVEIFKILTYCKHELQNPKIIYKLLEIGVRFSNSDFNEFIKSFMKYLTDEDTLNSTGVIKYPFHYDWENFTYEYTLNPVVLS